MSKSNQEPSGSAEKDGLGGDSRAARESSDLSGELPDREFGDRVVSADAADGSGRAEFAGGHDVVVGADAVTVDEGGLEGGRGKGDSETSGTSGGGGTSGGEVMTWRPERGPVTRVVAGLVLLMVLAGIGVMLYWSVLMFQGRPVPFLEGLFPPVDEGVEESEQIEGEGDALPVN